MTATTLIERDEIVETEGASFVPLAHLKHPDDPSGRTALCGVPILGIPTGNTECETCLKCRVLWAAQDWEPLPA